MALSSKSVEIIPFLRCPIGKNRLKLLSATEINQLNQLQSSKKLRHANGESVQSPLEQCLISEDGRYYYRIDNNVFILLEDLAIIADKKYSPKEKQLSEKKEIVRNYYDSFGWKKTGEDYHDADEFEDLRPESKEYIHRCHERLSNYLPKTGRYLLDVASGPIQYSEYIEYSKGYDARVCVDFSLLALKEAQKKLGDKGIYILGDITNLPFCDKTIDTAISLHTIYHVPAEHQSKAFREIQRIIKVNGSAVIIYCWHGSGLMRFFLFPQYIYRIVKQKIKRSGFNSRLQTEKPELYYQPYSYKWFVNQDWPFTYQIYSWRSVSVEFMQTYIHDKIGMYILRLAFWCENLMPKFLGVVGQYPLIYIRKDKE